ncbi:MAG: hypothetical protein OXK74_04115 [Gemmatimonadota bacterium]|nr:hypothetical protein [Gemmatimonadota bacterium]
MKRQDAARTALGSFAAMILSEVPEIARIVGRSEAERNSMPEFRNLSTVERHIAESV